jgi:hypothetical protein
MRSTENDLQTATRDTKLTAGMHRDMHDKCVCRMYTL